MLRFIHRIWPPATSADKSIRSACTIHLAFSATLVLQYSRPPWTFRTFTNTQAYLFHYQLVHPNPCKQTRTPISTHPSVILFDRQLSLHRMSMMSHWVKLIPLSGAFSYPSGSGFKFGGDLTDDCIHSIPFKFICYADFDSDEMNMSMST